ncbi:MAG: DNA-processing protein DprA [Saprospiraceae bacterium]|nr:DNA-processing protein DprA [Saprospiraceae bacterium]
MNKNLLHNIALTLIPDVGPVMAKLLISYCGSAESVFNTSKKELARIPNVGSKTIERIYTHQKAFKKAEEQIKYLEKHNCNATIFHSESYPQRLKHFDSSPLVLYYRGQLDLNHPRTVAIIGTRKPTEQGKVICENIIQGLQRYNVQIISGLAFGIDTCAHQVSVKLGVETIGVMGHGLDRMYPASNKNLAGQMVKKGGLLTEFPTGTNPDRENFPMRNRIIASMSDVIIVVESKKRGGSIITAEFANTYNKDVFAIPGRINDEVSEGCNRLIKQHKAHLLETADDVGYIMRWEEFDKEKVIQKSLFVDYTSDEQKIIDILKKSKQITIDELNGILKVPSSELASLLLNLEFKGAIRSLPGKKFILL